MRRCFIWLLSLLMLPCAGLAAGPVFLTNVNALATPSISRITFVLSEKTSGHVRSYTLPARIEIEFENAYLDFSFRKKRFEHANIKSMTKAWSSKDNIRFVFLIASNVEWKTRYLPGTMPGTVRLELEITSKNKVHAKLQQMFQEGVENTFHVVQAEAVNRQAAVSKPKLKIVQAREKQIVKKSQDSPVILDNKPIKRMMTIVIDAGHGGKDPGALGSRGTKEKDVVLRIAKLLAADINKQPNRRAVLTRQGDYYIPLRRRLQLARKGKADLFVAIHADAHFKRTAAGSSVYVLSTHGASSEAARWLAKRENYSELGDVSLNNLVDDDPILRSVMVDLAQTATIHSSLRLGQKVLDALDDISKLHHDEVERAPFMVLKAPDIPSILVETGFITNPSEEKRLRDPHYHQQLVRAMRQGIEDYLRGV